MTKLDKILKISKPAKEKESEKDTEKYLKLRIEAWGGKCYKQEGLRGLPDQMCLLPGGSIFFVETKSQGDRPRKQQLLRHDEMKALGQRVYVADTKALVDSALAIEYDWQHSL